MGAQKPNEFIGRLGLEATEPYELIRCLGLEAHQPYEFMRFLGLGAQALCEGTPCLDFAGPSAS